MDSEAKYNVFCLNITTKNSIHEKTLLPELGLDESQTQRNMVIMNLSTEL
jgi:hypothetical protein